MNILKFIIENWAVVVAACAVVGVFVFAIVKFTSLPTSKQIKKVKEWLLFAVVQAEKELGSKTGQLKLRKVYALFVNKYPLIANIISFERFSKWVDEALDKMQSMIESNEDVKKYIEGE